MSDIYNFSKFTLKNLKDAFDPNKPMGIFVRCKNSKILHKIVKGNLLSAENDIIDLDIDLKQLSDLLNPNKPGALLISIANKDVYKIEKGKISQALDNNKKPIKVK